MKKTQGPITVFSRPNGLGFSRLGLSIGKRVGSAVVRARLKRHLREAFRQEFPVADVGAGFDLVISAHAHEDQPTDAYRTVLRELLAQSARAWAKRGLVEP
jgi:ribonuclease P protein component